jgi:hypothetical protein
LLILPSERTGESVQGCGGATAGECAEHDHSDAWVIAPHVAQHLQAVHLGHLDIEGNDVRIQLRDPLQCGHTVRGEARHLDALVLFKRVTNQPANHDGVIDHQDADFPSRQ